MTNSSSTPQMTLADAVRKRTSIRAYTGRPLSAEDLAALERAMADAPRLPGAPVRFEIVTDPAQADRLLRGLVGGYGKVKQAPALLLGIAGQGTRGELGLGFTMEHIILEATRCGVGTCWISGTFDRRSAEETAHLSPGECVPAVSPLGYPAPGSESSFVKKLIGANKRKPLRDIVYASRWDGDSVAYLEAHADYGDIAEAVRWAPSAMNRQPWRLIFTETMLVLASVAASSALDDGIAMAHISISALEQGIAGAWDLDIDGSGLHASLGVPTGVRLIAAYPLG